tara:strand:+ start:32277 stop:33392 length:1116 start_codon:yes stop_codon:yes gene_type:complete
MPELYEEISQGAIDQLHQRFLNRIARQADKSVPDDVDNRATFVEKVQGVLLMGARLRQKISTTKIKSMVYENPAALDALSEEYKTLLSVDPWKHYRTKMDAQFAARKDTLLAEKTFAGRERIYVKMNCDHEVSNVQTAVADVLARQKYTIIDYKKGYAADAAGKQRFKIGKLLKKHSLYERFIQDETRTGQNKYIVFSRGQKDLEGMSTNRAWASCMASGGMYEEKVPDIIGSRTVIAYMISENDPEVNDPLSRILLKPYDRLEKRHLRSKAEVEKNGALSCGLSDCFNYYMTKAFRGGYEVNEQSELLRAGKVYGLSSELFTAAVRAFAADHLNMPQRGMYYFDDDIYRDTSARRVKVASSGKIKDLTGW